MKWKILAVAALAISLSSPVFADSLTLVQEPAQTIGPQSASSPCFIAATTCQQDTSIFGYTNYVSNGATSSYDVFSPIYTETQVSTVFPSLSMNVAIDVNTTNAQGETLDLFEVYINCTTANCSDGTLIYSYSGGGNIGSVSSNGNGYGDWTLQTVDLNSFDFDTLAFHAVWSNASDGGESFFVVAAPGGGTTGGTTGTTTGSTTSGSDSGTTTSGSDSGTTTSGSDSGTTTSGSDSGTTTSGSDSGTTTSGSDGGTTTSGSDSGTTTSGSDSGTTTSGSDSGTIDGKGDGTTGAQVPEPSAVLLLGIGLLAVSRVAKRFNRSH